MGHYQEFISKSAFAERAGVSAAAITKAASKGGRLHDTLCPRGKQIDCEHPAAKAYIREQVEKSKRGPVNPGKTSKKPSGGSVGRKAAKEDRQQSSNEGETHDVDDVIDYEDMTVREVVEKFGTDVRFAEYVKAVKEIQSIEKIRIDNRKKKKELLPSEVFDLLTSEIERCFITVLTDNIKTCASMAHKNALAEIELHETEDFMRDQIGASFSTFKQKMIRALKDMKE